jgi:hypothetical protein
MTFFPDTLLKTFCPSGEFPSMVNSQWDQALAPYKKIIMRQDEKIADLTRKLEELKTTTPAPASSQSVDANGDQPGDQQQQQKCNGVSFILGILLLFWINIIQYIILQQFTTIAPYFSTPMELRQSPPPSSSSNSSSCWKSGRTVANGWPPNWRRRTHCASNGPTRRPSCSS